MNMTNEIFVHAPAGRIFALASQTQRWPEILPHYRFVRVLRSEGAFRVVEMAARRGVIPVRWRAEQTDDAQKPEIAFYHVGGWTKGMRVRWRFEALPGGTRVSIEHELRSPIAPIAARFFIDPIASQTLACMKRIAESAE